MKHLKAIHYELILTTAFILALIALMWASLYGVVWYTHDSCNVTQRGTDYWYEVCEKKGEIDLTPIKNASYVFPTPEAEEDEFDEDVTLVAKDSLTHHPITWR